MSDERITYLQNKVTVLQSLTPTDPQNARDIADAVLTANEELRWLRGSNFAQQKWEDDHMSEFDFVKSTPGLGQIAMANRLVDAVDRGEMSEWRFGCFQQELAKALHPEARSLGEAITKTMDSEIGRIVWGPRRAVTTERNRVLMKRESGRVPTSSVLRLQASMTRMTTMTTALPGESME